MEPLERAVTQARRLLSSDKTDWSSEQRREIKSLVNDVEQLHDVVRIASQLLFDHFFAVGDTGSCKLFWWYICTEAG